MSITQKQQELQRRTIADYSVQWTRYHDLDGWTGSMEFFKDVTSPLITAEEVRDKYVGEIGSGPGRIVLMLLRAGAKHVMAIEPSDAMTRLQKHTEAYKDRITYLKVPGDRTPAGENFDYLFCIGVLMLIPDPRPTISAAFHALKPGGKFFIWVYGTEGNELFLFFARPFRWFTAKLPHPLLAALCWALAPPLWLYIRLCRILPLPMRDYMTKVLANLSLKQLQVDIYDQLNPTYCKYYTKQEAVALLADCGFEDVKFHHRHAYSWSVIGTKPSK